MFQSYKTSLLSKFIIKMHTLFLLIFVRTLILQNFREPNFASINFREKKKKNQRKWVLSLQTET